MRLWHGEGCAGGHVLFLWGEKLLLGVNMERLLILGAGQYGTVAKETAEAMGIFDEINFLDDSSENAVGKIEDIEKLDYSAAFVAIGNPDVRERLSVLIGDRKLATLIHPKALVMPSAVIGAGSIVEAGAIVCSNVTIGRATIVMSNAVVGHDAKVGNYCQLKYSSSIGERTKIPDKTKVECNVVWSE